MEATTRNRTLALAALFQNIDGVMQIARKGNVDEDLYKSALMSLLVDDAPTIESLYGGVSEMRVGLRALNHQLGGATNAATGEFKDLDATRYSLNILYLERKLQQDETILKRVLSGITDVQQLLLELDVLHPIITTRLAELYTQTISKLGPRIIIKGEQAYLSSPENAAKIRVLLMAGIRAALLWQQSGGNRWKLFFGRGAMQLEASQLLRGST
ncbi:high frequency lysogenization protein HflD [Thiofilum flexile]|uniref:high frequency lysogenization protein HflD n=1 Tax=Thiofilum flexile TaxID=125627 RepID=UPI00036556B4|nr:high frequency lysogenization protein HflD [Thiofilum flexile]